VTPAKENPSRWRSRAAAELSTPPLMATAVVRVIVTSMGISLKIFIEYTTFLLRWQPKPLKRPGYPGKMDRNTSCIYF